MDLSEIEAKRQTYDQQLDGFFDFVEVGRIGKYRIVHRETKTWLGIVDELDNIMVPLIYDNLIHRGFCIRSTITAGCDVFFGVVNIDEAHIILPAKYKYISLIANQSVMSCYDGKIWTLVSLSDTYYRCLSRSLLPFDNDKFVCLLRKCREDSYKIECWDEKDNHSQRRLRMLALDSDCPNRIKLINKYFNLVVYTDIYGQFLFANRNLKDVFPLLMLLFVY